MDDTIGPGSHAESFIWAATLCARRAGRSAEDRLLCKQEVLGSNPSRSTPDRVQRKVPKGLGCSAEDELLKGRELISFRGNYLQAMRTIHINADPSAQGTDHNACAV